MLFGDILQRCSTNFPHKVALICKDRALTFTELNNRVNKLANSLLDLGLKKGDRLGALLHNRLEFCEIYLASSRIGTIFVPINNQLKEKELSQLLEYISPRVLFVDTDFAELINSMKHNLPFIQLFIGFGEKLLTDFEQYDSMIERGSIAEPKVNVADDDVMTIILTSGTTGRPKGVMRTHRHNCLGAMVDVIESGIRDDDRAVFFSPPYHVMFESVFCRHLVKANTIVILREGNFDPEKLLHVISQHKITVLHVVPTMLHALLRVENVHKYDLSSLRLLIYSASPMPQALLERSLKTFNCEFLQGYGQTEAGPGITMLRPEDHLLDGTGVQLTRLTSAGHPMLGCKVRIVDQSGHDVSTGEVGEIIAKEEATTIGYWNLPEESAKLIKDGWLYTGDLGRFDNNGYVYVVDRKNDMLISGGKNIYPREIEEVLYQHEAVLHAVVVGVPDDYWGEAVKAVIVLKPNMAVSEEEIIVFCKKNMASYKKPRSVEFWTELPMSPSGKILKKVIRNNFWKDRNSKI